MLLQVPIQADMELGRKAMKEFPHSTIHHPKWTPMVKSVGWELVTSSSQAVDENSNYYSWDLGIIDHGTMVNAFALPGGVVRHWHCSNNLT
jgi:predicted Zn-dependent protease